MTELKLRRSSGWDKGVCATRHQKPILESKQVLVLGFVWQSDHVPGTESSCLYACGASLVACLR